MKKSVGLIGPSFPNFKGGIVHFSESLFEALIDSKRSTKFYSFSRSYPKFLYKGENKTNKIDIKNKNEINMIDWLNPISWIKTAKILKENEHNYIIFQWWTWFWTLPYLIIITFLKKNNSFGSKLIFIIHNYNDHESNIFTNLASRLVLKNADLFIVHSKQEYLKISSHFENKKIKTINLPEWDFFKKKEHISKKSAQEKLKVVSPTILFFGHIRPYKGVDLLLKALKYLQNNVSLIIAGEVWSNKMTYTKIINEFNLQERVIFNDEYIKDKDVPIYFSASDIVVLPYRRATGTGVSKIASLFNKKIVATPVGDFIEMSEYYENIFIAKSIKPIDIAKKITEVLNKTAKNNNFKIKKTITWNSYLEKIFL